MSTSSLQSSRNTRYRVIVAATLILGMSLLLVRFVGAQTDTIAATVSATNLAVSVSDGSIAFGSVALNTATSTHTYGDQTQTVTNDGSDAQLNVAATDATGGATWDLNTSVGSDQFTLEVSTTTGSSFVTLQAADTYATASSTFSSLTNGDLDFRLTTPNASSDFVQKSITITVQVTSL